MSTETAEKPSEAKPEVSDKMTPVQAQQMAQALLNSLRPPGRHRMLDRDEDKESPAEWKANNERETEDMPEVDPEVSAEWRERFMLYVKHKLNPRGLDACILAYGTRDGLLIGVGKTGAVCGNVYRWVTGGGVPHYQKNPVLDAQSFVETIAMMASIKLSKPPTV
jgi:hypothetical protein